MSGLLQQEIALHCTAHRSHTPTTEPNTVTGKFAQLAVIDMYARGDSWPSIADTIPRQGIFAAEIKHLFDLEDARAELSHAQRAGNSGPASAGAEQVGSSGAEASGQLHSSCNCRAATLLLTEQKAHLATLRYAFGWAHMIGYGSLVIGFQSTRIDTLRKPCYARL